MVGTRGGLGGYEGGTGGDGVGDGRAGGIAIGGGDDAQVTFAAMLVTQWVPTHSAHWMISNGE